VTGAAEQVRASGKGGAETRSFSRRGTAFILLGRLSRSGLWRAMAAMRCVSAPKGKQSDFAYMCRLR
jgi:hypothetical protein